MRSVPAFKWNNRVCTLEFDQRVFTSNAPDAVIPAFGARYTFTLSDAVDSVPEYLVHFDVLRVNEHGRPNTRIAHPSGCSKLLPSMSSSWC